MAAEFPGTIARSFDGLVQTFINLIEEFYKLTGIPLLFNTSLNLAGDPLAETLDDVMKILTDSEMEYCYMPEHATLIKL